MNVLQVIQTSTHLVLESTKKKHRSNILDYGYKSEESFFSKECVFNFFGNSNEAEADTVLEFIIVSM